jgi:hypothetical protein
VATYEPEPLIYREEVRAILFAMADVVVELRHIASLLGGDDAEPEEKAE